MYKIFSTFARAIALELLKGTEGEGGTEIGQNEGERGREREREREKYREVVRGWKWRERARRVISAGDGCSHSKRGAGSNRDDDLFDPVDPCN